MVAGPSTVMGTGSAAATGRLDDGIRQVADGRRYCVHEPGGVVPGAIDRVVHGLLSVVELVLKAKR